MNIGLYFYNFILNPLALILSFLLWPFAPIKYRQSLIYRIRRTFKSQVSAEALKNSRPIWIHASSGEIEYAKSVIREIHQHLKIPVFVTTSTPSALDGVLKIEGVIAAAAAPLDFFSEVYHLIEKTQPRAVLFARTDVWPGLSFCLSQKKIPSLLFAATFAENSSRLKGIGAWFSRMALVHLNEIFVVSKEDFKNLQSLQLPVPVKIAGDTRFDQVIFRLQNSRPLKSSLQPDLRQHPVLVAGSTWPQDEEVLLPALKRMPDLKCILAPHEIDEEHLNSITEKLERLGIEFCFYSRASAWHEEQVLILDQMGILADIYSWGSFAFVGGSFKKQIHSVMEPLAHGLPVCSGPYFQNNREFVEVLDQKDFVSVVRSVDEMTRLLTEWMKKISRQKNKIHEHVLAKTGATEQVIQWLAQNSN